MAPALRPGDALVVDRGSLEPLGRGDTVVLRDEELATVAVGASYDLNNDWALSLHYRYSENDSSDPLFSYERNLVTIGVRYLFGP